MASPSRALILADSPHLAAMWLGQVAGGPLLDTGRGQMSITPRTEIYDTRESGRAIRALRRRIQFRLAARTRGDSMRCPLMNPIGPGIPEGLLGDDDHRERVGRGISYGDLITRAQKEHS